MFVIPWLTHHRWPGHLCPLTAANSPVCYVMVQLVFTLYLCFTSVCIFTFEKTVLHIFGCHGYYNVPVLLEFLCQILILGSTNLFRLNVTSYCVDKLVELQHRLFQLLYTEWVEFLYNRFVAVHYYNRLYSDDAWVTFEQLYRVVERATQLRSPLFSRQVSVFI